jgi:hypothetical protein
LKNADGTVWIANDRIAFRDLFYVLGSGLISIMDKEGNIRIVNEILNEWEISAIGLRSPTNDPMDPDGQITVRLYSKPESGANTFNKSVNSVKEGLFKIDTTLGLRRLSDAPDPNDDYIIIYKDNQGDLYTINLYSNTLTNWTQNRNRTWTDKELLKNS